MARDFEVRGSHDLAAVARRCKDAGNGQLRRHLLAGVRGSGRRAIPSVRASAIVTLPKRGGLNQDVAGQDYRVQASYATSGARVRIVGRGMRELTDIDEGRVRHPVFKNRHVWVQQAVRSGFFSRPLLARRPYFLRDVQQVLNDVARQIARRF